MAILRAEITLPYITDMPGDVAINTFHLSMTGTPDPTEVVAGLEAITKAYGGGTVGANGFSWGNVLSPIIKRTADAGSIRVYDLADAKPRPIIYQEHFTIDGNTDVTGLPMEVAMAVSYHAAGVAGVDRRSLRGRIYLGPVNADCMGVIGTSIEGIATNVRADMATVAETVRSEVVSASGGAMFWGVYSRKLSQIHEIVGGFVDNEFDTQRRRGVEPTARSTWGAA